MEPFNQFTESIEANFPIEIKYKQNSDTVSAYIPIINTYFYGKTIDEVKRKVTPIVSMWIKFNLEEHMLGGKKK